MLPGACGPVGCAAIGGSAGSGLGCGSGGGGGGVVIEPDGRVRGPARPAGRLGERGGGDERQDCGGDRRDGATTGHGGLLQAGAMDTRPTGGPAACYPPLCRVGDTGIRKTIDAPRTGASAYSQPRSVAIRTAWARSTAPSLP